MTCADWRAVAGFALLAVGAVTGALWVYTAHLPIGPGPWLRAPIWVPIVTALSLVVGIGFVFFSRLFRPASYASILRHASRDILAAMENHSNALERIVSKPDDRATSLARIGDGVEDVARTLHRRCDRIEDLVVMASTATSSPREVDSAGPEPDFGEIPATAEDLEYELKAAWKRYRDRGDGHFRAHGLRDELASAAVDVVVRGLDGPAGVGVLVVENPDATESGFFVVPDFSKPAKSVDYWFENKGSRALGALIDEVIVVAQGRFSESGVEVVKRGSVA